MYLVYLMPNTNQPDIVSTKEMSGRAHRAHRARARWPRRTIEAIRPVGDARWNRAVLFTGALKKWPRKDWAGGNYKYMWII